MPPVDELYEMPAIKKINQIINDTEHLLHKYFEYLKSGRRLISVKCRSTRFQNTFVPYAVHVYNSITK